MITQLDGFYSEKSKNRLILSETSQDATVSKTLAIVNEFPVFMGCTNENQFQDVHADQYWSIDNKGILSITPRIPTSLLYQNSHNHPVGKVWEHHHRSFAKFVSQNLVGDVIFEIGGAHAMALVELVKINPLIKTFMQDINPIPVKEYTGKVITAPFESNTLLPEGTQTIIHSHVLEHMHDPFLFLQNIATKQQIGNVQVFSWPNMEMMLKRGDLNFLNFEHDKYITQDFVRASLENLGYRILDQKNFQEHSIFISAIKVAEPGDSTSFNALEDATLEDSIINYFQSLMSLVNSFNVFLDDSYDLKCVFGAHVFTQYLIAAGLKINLIDFILDNSREKANKRLYGTSVFVKNPEDLLLHSNGPLKVLVVGSVATYAEEILLNLQSTFSNSGIELHVVFPISGKPEMFRIS